MNVEVVVFNYNPQPIAELVIQGDYLGGFYGGYGLGGTGGKSYCCIEVMPGEAEVRWRYSGREGDSKVGLNDRATALIPAPAGEYKYLGVHISPDSTVEFRLTQKYPLDKKYD